VSVKHLKSLVIDPFEDQWGFRGYIADAGDETIIIYSSGNLHTFEENLYGATKLFSFYVDCDTNFRIMQVVEIKNVTRTRNSSCAIHRPCCLSDEFNFIYDRT